MSLPRSKLPTREFDISEFESHMPGWEDSNFGIRQERSLAAFKVLERGSLKDIVPFFDIVNGMAPGGTTKPIAPPDRKQSILNAELEAESHGLLDVTTFLDASKQSKIEMRLRPYSREDRRVGDRCKPKIGGDLHTSSETNSLSSAASHIE
jgi:hypothetical protein